MPEVKDPYYERDEVSNSDLSWLKKYWLQQDVIYDIEKAYRFGTLIDCMITEPDKVNYFNRTCAHYQYTFEEFETAEHMKKEFWKNELCRSILAQSQTQVVMTERNQKIFHEGYTFFLPVRCKWDLWIPGLKWGGDIKSTTATTQKQFEEAVRHFDYDRQRAWYMDIAGSNQDLLIGISKVNFKIFQVPIRRDDALFKSGKEKYQEIAFKYWYLLN